MADDGRIKIGSTSIVAREDNSNISELPIQMGSYYPLMYVGETYDIWRVFPILDEYRFWMFDTDAYSSCTYINCNGVIKANGEGSAKVVIYTKGRIYTKLLNPIADYLPNNGRFTIPANGGYYRYTGSTEMTVSPDGTVTAPDRGTVEGPSRRVVVKTTAVHKEDPLQGGTYMINPTIMSDQTYTGFTVVEVVVWQEGNKKDKTSEEPTGFDLPTTEDNELLMSNGFVYNPSQGGWIYMATSEILNSGTEAERNGQIPISSETFYVTYTYTSGADGGSGNEIITSDWYVESGETPIGEAIVDNIVLPTSPSWLEVGQYGTTLTALANSGNTANTCRSTTAVCTFDGLTKTVTIKQCRGAFMYDSYNINSIQYRCDDEGSYVTISDTDNDANIEVTDYTLVTFKLSTRKKYWSDWKVNRTNVGRGGTDITAGSYVDGYSVLYCYLEGEDTESFGICLPKKVNNKIVPDTSHYYDAIDLTQSAMFGADATRNVFVVAIGDDMSEDMDCKLFINAYYSKADYSGVIIDMETEEDVTEDYGDQAHELIVGEKRRLEIDYVEPS